MRLLGGGYWTGGLNPGLMWLWPSLGSSLTNIDPAFWLISPDAVDTNNGKCLRLSYDRTSQRYALQVRFYSLLIFLLNFNYLVRFIRDRIAKDICILFVNMTTIMEQPPQSND